MWTAWKCELMKERGCKQTDTQIHRLAYKSVLLRTDLPVHLSVCLSVCPSVPPSLFHSLFSLSICLSVYRSNGGCLSHHFPWMNSRRQQQPPLPQEEFQALGAIEKSRLKCVHQITPHSLWKRDKGPMFQNQTVMVHVFGSYYPLSLQQSYYGIFLGDLLSIANTVTWWYSEAEYSYDRSFLLWLVLNNVFWAFITGVCGNQSCTVCEWNIMFLFPIMKH